MADMQDPFELFGEWYQKAWDNEPADANAMALATANSDGFPNVRIVLLKGFDADGFVFYTNMESQKGQELEANAQAALCWHWKSLKKQIRVRGPISVVSDEEADDYYATRPRDSQIGAWASDQSQPLSSRTSLMAKVAKITAEKGTNPERPPFWGGYRIAPLEIEFWADGAFRLHDRFRWRRPDIGSAWEIQRLNP